MPDGAQDILEISKEAIFLPSILFVHEGTM